MNRTGFIVAVESYLVRKGLVALLNRFPGTQVVREFESAHGLIEFMKHYNNEFLVISHPIFNQSTDLYLSQTGLLERTILITDHRSDRETRSVNAFIDIEDGKMLVMDKFRKIIDSETDPGEKARGSGLTPREKTIVRLVSLGLTNKQIAGQLFLSAHTVITHRKNIGSKLGIKSVSGLTVYAIVNNIITIEEVTSKPDR
ncbi:MAG: LuxR C-terminal-related transcriptional regulator [Bacteroidota bacterium]